MFLLRDILKKDTAIKRSSAMFYDSEEPKEETLDLSSKTRVGKSTFYRPGIGKKSRERLNRHNSIIVPAITWSEANNVIRSGSLERLKCNEKVLQERKFEIITSELNYLNFLNILCTLYYKSTLSTTCSRAEWQIMFGNILDVKSASETVLNDMVAHWEANVMLSGIYETLRHHASVNLPVLEDYCGNLPLALEVYNKLIATNGNFEAELKEINSGHGMCLQYLLTRPMNRVTAMPLLLEGVLKLLPPGSSEYNECSQALSDLRRVAACCNEATRDAM